MFDLIRFVATLRGHVGAVYRLAWSADSRQLVSASKDSTLKVRVAVEHSVQLTEVEILVMGLENV
jgi:WD40 repeat protein